MRPLDDDMTMVCHGGNKCTTGCLSGDRCHMTGLRTYESWPGNPGIDYDRLAKAVVAEQERKAAEKERRKQLEQLGELLPYFTRGERPPGYEWNVLTICPAFDLIAPAIRAYIKAEAA